MEYGFGISVIIPVYNVEEYIFETLNSLYKQTFENFELLLIDDGSTDKSIEIAKTFKSKFKQIRVFSQNNSGPSKARNLGLKYAIGKYIVFIDSDDLLPIDSLEVRYKIAEEKNLDILICGTEKFYLDNKMKMKKHYLSEDFKKINRNSDILWTMGPCNKIFNRNIIKNLKFPEDINYAEDQAFLLEAYLNSNKIYATQYTGYFYRMRNNPNESLTQQMRVNSPNVIKQVNMIWELAVKNIDNAKVTNKNFIKREYFYRLIDIDIWPPFRYGLLSDNKDVQIKTIESSVKLMNDVSLNEINRLGKIKRFLFFNILKNKFISNKSKVVLSKIIIYSHNLILKGKRVLNG